MGTGKYDKKGNNEGKPTEHDCVFAWGKRSPMSVLTTLSVALLCTSGWGLGSVNVGGFSTDCAAALNSTGCELRGKRNSAL